MQEQCVNQSSETLKKPYFILREAGAAGLWPWMDIKDAGTEPARGEKLQAGQVLTSKWQLLQERISGGPAPWPAVGMLPVPLAHDRKGNGIRALQAFAGTEKLMRASNL